MTASCWYQQETTSRAVQSDAFYLLPTHSYVTATSIMPLSLALTSHPPSFHFLKLAIHKIQQLRMYSGAAAGAILHLCHHSALMGTPVFYPPTYNTSCCLSTVCRIVMLRWFVHNTFSYYVYYLSSRQLYCLTLLPALIMLLFQSNTKAYLHQMSSKHLKWSSLVTWLKNYKENLLVCG